MGANYQVQLWLPAGLSTNHHIKPVYPLPPAGAIGPGLPYSRGRSHALERESRYPPKGRMRIGLVNSCLYIVIYGRAFPQV